MTDDAQTVRDALRARQRGTGSTRNTVPALDALDRLLADRDRLAARVKELEAVLERVDQQTGAVEGTDEDMYEALVEIQRLARAALDADSTPSEGPSE